MLFLKRIAKIDEFLAETKAAFLIFLSVRQTFYFLLLLIVSYLNAQSTDIPLNFPAYKLLSEWDVKSEKGVFTSDKPISRRVFNQAANDAEWMKSRSDQFNKEYVLMETREYEDTVELSQKSIFGKFYKYPSDMYSAQVKDFDLHVNPIVVLAAGKDMNGSQEELLYENYRGLELRGTIDEKFSFYTLLTENQARYPEYAQAVIDSTLGVPYEGFWKQYDMTAVDFLRAQAYVDFNATKHLEVQFGYGKHFIGDGKRSLILSDYGNNYPYLRLKTQVWKIQYTNIFAQLIAQTKGGDYGLLGVGAFPKKAFANHHLSVQIKPNLTIGLFESIILGDSSGTNSPGIFIPIIFYKAMEQQDGSGGNTLIGADFKWNLWKTLSLYGQLVIDEMVVSEVFGNSDWWGNKQGFQLGAKYFDALGVQNLNVQLELNKVRPYVYSHESHFTNYSHYNMAMAHPLGANFREIIASVNYQPIPKLTLQADLLFAKYGNDSDSSSWGRDITKGYGLDNRPQDHDYGNDMFQGETTDLMMIQAKASYMIKHNLFLELNSTIRNEQSDVRENSTMVFGTALRWNFPYRSYLF